MKVNSALIRTLSVITAVLVMVGLSSLAMGQENSTVVVEEIETGQPDNAEKAAELWDQTKQKTGEAASTAAEYSKVQGTRALEATKRGAAKGADLAIQGAGAVAEGSKKAWDATKEATGKGVEYTTEKVKQVGTAISEAMENDGSGAPVTERSVDTASGDTPD